MGDSSARAEAPVLFEAGHYLSVITTLEDRARSAHEFCLLGMSLLRTGRFQEAEMPLHKASILGDDEGAVELGNLLRLLGRFDEAHAHFEAISETLTGELQLRLLRWWGVSKYQSGDAEAGLKLVERAWYGYMALGDDELTARVTQSLAQMHLQSGNLVRAKQLYNEAIRALTDQSPQLTRLGVLRGLLDIQLRSHDFVEASATLEQAKRALGHSELPRERALLLSAEADLLHLTGQTFAYGDTLQRLHSEAEAMQDFELRVWSTARFVDHLSLIGQHSRATAVLVGFGTASEQWPPELWAAHGVLERRRNQFQGALDSLGRAAALFRAQGRAPDLIRTLLHAAAAAHRIREHELCVAQLKEALFEMLRLKQLAAFRPELEELSELMHFALLEPETAPLLEPVLDNLANLAGSPRLPEDGLMRVQVTTLGRVAVFKDGAEVDLSLRGSALLLAYLSLYPRRTRAELQLALYPEKDAKTGSGYIRAAFSELREKLGRDIVTFDGPHNAPQYRLGPMVHLDLDLTQFREAIDKDEVARALALYRGPFMPEVDESEWVQQVREECMLSLAFALQTHMARYQSVGDFRRVILLANQYLRIDPYDREVLERRLEAAQVVASPQELARYTAELRRLFN